MGKQRVKFTFPTDLVTQPIIYDLGRKFNVVTNIRRADVREEMGWVVLELEGDDQEIQQGIDWVGSIGVRVDPVAGDVVEG
ncbi:MAG: NIL domain-containing protein [Dehalococcoidia bacterium]|nr:NIL domain-containing protein [Chloroflexota bacterium]